MTILHCRHRTEQKHGKEGVPFWSGLERREVTAEWNGDIGKQNEVATELSGIKTE